MDLLRYGALRDNRPDLGNVGRFPLPTLWLVNKDPTVSPKSDGDRARMNGAAPGAESTGRVVPGGPRPIPGPKPLYSQCK